MILNRIRQLLFTLALPLIPAISQGQVIEVSQESEPNAGDFDANVLGSIAPVVTCESIGDYYDYRSSNQSYNGLVPPAIGGMSQLFLVYSTNTGETSLVVVHDEPSFGPNNQRADMEVNLSGDPDGADFQVQDELEDHGTHPDHYATNAKGTQFLSDQGWGACCTDGFAIGSIDGPWTATVEFTLGPTDLTQWRAYSGDGATVGLRLELKRRVRLRLNTPGTVGDSYCFCDGTGAAPPCGNPGGASTGCANSTGCGSILTGSGSASTTGDDLLLTVSQTGPGQSGILYMGGGSNAVPFGDGHRCVSAGGVGIYRFPLRQASPSGSYSYGPGLVAFSLSNFSSGGHIAAGATWRFQGWYRDPLGPCSSGFNLSNGLAVTFEL